MPTNAFGFKPKLCFTIKTWYTPEGPVTSAQDNQAATCSIRIKRTQHQQRKAEKQWGTRQLADGLSTPSGLLRPARIPKWNAFGRECLIGFDLYMESLISDVCLTMVSNVFHWFREQCQGKNAELINPVMHSNSNMLITLSVILLKLIACLLIDKYTNALFLQPHACLESPRKNAYKMHNPSYLCFLSPFLPFFIFPEFFIKKRRITKSTKPKEKWHAIFLAFIGNCN